MTGKFGYLAVLVGSLVQLSLCPSANAQRKPDPPPLPVEDHEPKSAVSEEFLAAYKRARSPRMLIYGHMLAANVDRADELNELSTLKAVEGRLKPYFRHPEVTAVFRNQSQFKCAVAFEAMVRTDEVKAARLLTQEEPADIVVLVTMLEQTGRADGARYLCEYQLLDVNRGTDIGGWSWEMTADQADGFVSTNQVQKHAQALARKITDDFRVMFPDQAGVAARLFTIHVVGVPDTAAAELRDVLAGIAGVQSVERARFESGTASYAVHYNKDALDLSRAAREAFAKHLRLDVMFNTSREGLVTLTAASGTQPAGVEAQPAKPLEHSSHLQVELVGVRSTTEVQRTITLFQSMSGVNRATAYGYLSGSDGQDTGYIEVYYSIRFEELVTAINAVKSPPFEITDPRPDSNLLRLRAARH